MNESLLNSRLMFIRAAMKNLEANLFGTSQARTTDHMPFLIVLRTSIVAMQVSLDTSMHVMVLELLCSEGWVMQ